jgi:hypothetical protein
LISTLCPAVVPSDIREPPCGTNRYQLDGEPDECP